MSGKKYMCDKDETMGGLSKGRLLNNSAEQATETVDKTKSKEPETMRTMLVLGLRGFNAEEMFFFSFFLSKVMKLTK